MVFRVIWFIGDKGSNFPLENKISVNIGDVKEILWCEEDTVWLAVIYKHEQNFSVMLNAVELGRQPFLQPESWKMSHLNHKFILPIRKLVDLLCRLVESKHFLNYHYCYIVKKLFLRQEHNVEAIKIQAFIDQFSQVINMLENDLPASKDGLPVWPARPVIW